MSHPPHLSSSRPVADKVLMGFRNQKIFFLLWLVINHAKNLVPARILFFIGVFNPLYDCWYLANKFHFPDFLSGLSSIAFYFPKVIHKAVELFNPCTFT